MQILNFFLVLLIFTSNSVKGQFHHIPPPPKKISPIQDYAGVLSTTDIDSLNKKLISYSKITSTEILVSIVQDLYGEDPSILASKWGEKWHIGKKYKNNGIVLLLSVRDKKISIQNGYGIEPYITDLSTGQIIKKIKPQLQRGDFYQAIDFSTKEVFNILNNKFKNNNKYRKKKKNNNFFLWTFLIPFSIFLVAFLLHRKNDLEFYSLLINPFFLTNFLFRNSHQKYEEEENEDFFDDDGFGGGGSFGGGGASDNWD
ncbi:TPM domain-containing protein [Blattabacterium cuenoti]|uniref:TPM domain-containing protein n=1 Tax=Blattabacterium cuenoti TaxID=1653831 RepID=UPI001EEA238F|nr:TPM domain-containing protein [Blattabacterium cuenoti]